MFRAQLLAILRRVGLRLIRLYAIRRNVHADKSVHIGIGTVIEATHRLDIGVGTYIGKNCTIVANGSIGKGVLIANTVGLVGALDHDFRSIGVPVRFAPWIGDADYPYDAQKDRIDIEDDVWIGYGAIILSTVRVGRGAIVAAGSVVRKDVEPYSIVAGVPARVVGERFDHHVRQHHEVGLVQFWAKRGAKHLNGTH